MGRRTIEGRTAYGLSLDKATYNSLKSKNQNIAGLINHIVKDLAENGKVDKPELIQRTIKIQTEYYQQCKEKQLPINRLINQGLKEFDKIIK